MVCDYIKQINVLEMEVKKLEVQLARRDEIIASNRSRIVQLINENKEIRQQVINLETALSSCILNSRPADTHNTKLDGGE